MSATAARSQGPRALRPRVPEPSAEPAGAQLAAAVLAVQAAAPTLVRNALGQAGARTYGYADLTSVVDVILPLLVEHELLWRTFPTVLDGQPALRYQITHVASGESDEDTMLLCVTRAGAQEQGSGITYARRYALCAYLNLTVEPDDDGAAASSHEPGPERCSEAQRTMLRAKARAAGLDPGRFANALKASWGDPPAQWADDTAAEAWTERALERLPARRVGHVITAIDGAKSAS